MIYECQGGHISFSKDDLNTWGKDLQKIIEDPNMPRDVKKEITKIFGMNIW